MRRTTLANVPRIAIKAGTLSWLLLLVCLATAPSNAQVLVDSKKKPPDAWQAYTTRTLDTLPGFTAGAPNGALSPYGGLLTNRLDTTGYIHARRIDGRWWLVDPDGYRFLHVGVASVAPGRSETTRAAFQQTFRTDATWAQQTVALLKAHGFNGTGAWSDTAGLAKNPTRVVYTAMWNFMSSYGKKRGGTFQQPGHTGYPDDCIFVFDPGFEAFADEYAKQIAATRADPWLLGHFSDNELPFRPDALDRYLKQQEGDPGRAAARTWLEARPGGAQAPITDADRVAFLSLVVDRYFSITTRAIRKYDPNHLCLGSRFHGNILSQPVVFQAAGRHLDVVSVNYYNTWTPDADRMRTWERASGKPVLITEWYTKGMDSGMPNTTGAGWIVKTQRDRGLFYQNFALALLESNVCVGWHWFKYMDNDPDDATTDPSNRDSNKGIVSFRYAAYEPLLDLMKALNERVYALVRYFDTPGVGQQTADAEARSTLMRSAEEAMTLGPSSVMQKTRVPPSGDRHDFISIAPYWWPDPAKPKGLPYIRRDGAVNPESKRDVDDGPFDQMHTSVTTLVRAYQASREERFAARAALLLRVWFLDPATRMNPNLDYGQAVPGLSEGRGEGIIVTRRLAGMLEAVRSLEVSPAWTASDNAGLKAWGTAFTTWLRTSKNGRAEAAAKNNHGTWYDAQVVALLLYADRRDEARAVIETSTKKRLAAQIEPDGRQPQELQRTRAWSYSVMNLDGWFTLARLADEVGIDLWHYRSKDGRSVQGALDYLVPFADGTRKWPHPQITPFETDRLVALLRQAAVTWKSDRYAVLADRLLRPDRR